MTVRSYNTTEALFAGSADLLQTELFTVGDRVRIRGLVQAKQYNDCAGAIISVEDGGRFGVLLDDSKKKLALRTANMWRLFKLAAGGEGAPCDILSGQLLLIQRPASFRDSHAFMTATEAHGSFNLSEQKGWQRLPVAPTVNNKTIIVKPSLQPGGGMGVFSGDEPIAMGSPVTQYAGWRVPSETKSQSRYHQDIVLNGGGPKAIKISIIGDPSQHDPALGVGQIINDAGCLDVCHLREIEDAVCAYKEASNEANVQVKLQEGLPVVFALRDIPPGTELLHSYSSTYWLDALKLRVEPTHDIALLRRIEACQNPDEGRRMPQLTVKDGEGLWNEVCGRAASAEDCEDILRMVMGGPFISRSGEPLSQLAVVALLQGAAPEELSDAVYILADSGNLPAVVRQASQLGGYRPLRLQMADQLQQKLRQVIAENDPSCKAYGRCEEALRLLSSDLDAALDAMERGGALRGLIGYNRIIQGLSGCPELGALAISAPEVWASAASACAPQPGKAF
eukprot:gnl/TRDRNA2_/TRDRNA2_42003_c0_seq1.p1 gnl/TRDRNA2_/TRDRNA2_42003_c0~~gnl/TRDRNA2_/TRDRNA2_42003_c0_seq1.p1  ORF type:complete len:509 (-),score=92.17 gnl/TRDRNA2_/TRDRNA2_42003_c0_seq1:75-1601(-)